MTLFLNFSKYTLHQMEYQCTVFLISEITNEKLIVTKIRCIQTNLYKDKDI